MNRCRERGVVGEKIDGGGIFEGVWVGRWAWILIRRVSCGCGEVVDWGAFLLLLSSLFVFVVQFAVGGLIESSRLVSLFLSPTFGRIWRYELTGDPDRRCCEATLALEKPRAFLVVGLQR